MNSLIWGHYIEDILENIQSPNCLDEFTEYLKNTYPEAFEYVKKGSIAYGYETNNSFSILFKQLSHKNDEKYNVVRNKAVNMIRSMGYSSDIYIVGGLGTVIEIRNKPFSF